MIEKTKLMNLYRLGDLSFLRCFIGCAAFFIASSEEVHAELRVGNSGAVAFGVDSRWTHSSNIFRNSDELDDMIFELMPSIRYRFDQGAVRVDADAGVNMIRYDDFDSNDADDIKTHIVIKFPYDDSGDKQRYDIQLKGGYNENTLPNDSVQDIVQTDEINFSANGRYYISDLTFLKVGAEWVDQQSQTSGFEDMERIAVPIEVFYDYSQVLSYGFGYRYTETNVVGDPPEADSKDHALFLAAVGQLASSLSAEVRIGGQTREFSSTVYQDETVFFAESLIKWVISDLTVIEFHLGNGFDTDLNGVSKETLFTEVGVQHQLSNKLRALTGVSYEDAKYSNSRDDDQFSLSIGAIYSLIEGQFQIQGGLRYADRDSSELRADYDVMTAEIALSYLF
jgi:hypothetical protein